MMVRLMLLLLFAPKSGRSLRSRLVRLLDREVLGGIARRLHQQG